MAKATTPQERAAIALIDRHTAAKEAIITRLTSAILRILAELFADEQRAIGIPDARPTPAPRLHSETGVPVMAPRPESKADVASQDRASAVVKAVDTPRVRAEVRRALEADVAPEKIVEVFTKAQVYTPERMQARRDAAAKIATLVRTAETTTANLQAAQNDALARQAGKRPAPSAKGFAPEERPRKVDPEAEWLRPIYRYLESARQGRTHGESAQLAADKVRVQVEDDLNVASREGNRMWMRRNLGVVTGYRRVIHPELSVGGTCALCVAAATRIYKANRLHPLHARCKCGVVPIFNSEWGDVADALNIQDMDEFLARTYGDAGSTSRNDLKRIRYKTSEHSELGLQFVGHHHPSSRQAPIPAEGGASRAVKRRRTRPSRATPQEEKAS